MERRNSPNFESKERPSFNLDITVTRHGPKSFISSDLSPEGKDDTRTYFQEAYDGVILDEQADLRIEHSSIKRTAQTAGIFKTAINNKSELIVDERLSEGSIAKDLKVIEKLGGPGKWIEPWTKLDKSPAPGVKSGKEAVRQFCDWLIDKINNAKNVGGKKEVDAFSHMPVMIAFLAKVQQETGVQLLEESWGDKVQVNNMIRYLDQIQIHADSRTPDIATLRFNDKMVEISIQDIRRWSASTPF